ncbi:hypothetical protein AVEN_196046-1 [Araneus ventricosus]|uniref:Uncharacterized protein n=1 Tax=Araneus ventricosus TaxID=182803 RepID=A0A4Y2NF24_ARAVE|nr:hypothetical protein AVEN_196046-1 [Araneus ventricosus]
MATRCYLPLGSSRKVLNFFKNRSLAENCTRKFTNVLQEPAQPFGNKRAKWMSAEEAVRAVKSGGVHLSEPLLAPYLFGPFLLSQAVSQAGDKLHFQSLPLKSSPLAPDWTPGSLCRRFNELRHLLCSVTHGVGKKLLVANDLGGSYSLHRAGAKSSRILVGTAVDYHEYIDHVVRKLLSTIYFYIAVDVPKLL